MRLNACFRVFLVLLLVTLIWICIELRIELRMDADTQRQRDERNLEWYQKASMRWGFWEGTKAAAQAMTFDTNTGQWTLQTTNLFQSLWKLIPPTNAAEQAQENKLLSIFPKKMIFDTNAGQWMMQITNLLKPLRRGRYGGRYDGRGGLLPPTNSPSGH